MSTRARLALALLPIMAGAVALQMGHEAGPHRPKAGDWVRISDDLQLIDHMLTAKQFTPEELKQVVNRRGRVSQVTETVGKDSLALAVSGKEEPILVPVEIVSVVSMEEAVAHPFAPPGESIKEIRVGDVVKLTSSEAQARLGFQSDSLRWVPGMRGMLGKEFTVRKVRGDAVGLPSSDGSDGGVWYFPKDLATRQEKRAQEEVKHTAPAKTLEQGLVEKAANTLQAPPPRAPVKADGPRVGDIVRVSSDAAWVEKSSKAINQPWTDDMSMIVGHDFKVLGLKDGGNMVALPASDGVSKIWIPASLVALQKPEKSKGSTPSSKTGLKPQWNALKAVWLKNTFTGTEGCSFKDVKDAMQPIARDLLLKSVSRVAAPRQALLETAGARELTGRTARETSPSLSGPMARALVQCVLEQLPPEFRGKAASYLARGGGFARREVPTDIKNSAFFHYMTYSLTAKDAPLAQWGEEAQEAHLKRAFEQEATKEERDAHWRRFREMRSKADTGRGRAKAQALKTEKQGTKTKEAAAKKTSAQKDKAAAGAEAQPAIKPELQPEAKTEQYEFMQDKDDQVPVLKVQK